MNGGYLERAHGARAARSWYSVFHTPLNPLLPFKVRIRLLASLQ
jgi:hypothetical protein